MVSQTYVRASPQQQRVQHQPRSLWERPAAPDIAAAFITAQPSCLRDLFGGVCGAGWCAILCEDVPQICRSRYLAHLKRLVCNF